MESAGIANFVREIQPSRLETPVANNRIDSGRSKQLPTEGGFGGTNPSGSGQVTYSKRVRRPRKSVSPVRDVRLTRRSSSPSLALFDEDDVFVSNCDIRSNRAVNRKDISNSSTDAEKNVRNTALEHSIVRIRNDEMPKRDPTDMRSDIDIRQAIVVAVLGQKAPVLGDLLIPMVNGEADVHHFVNLHTSNGSYEQMRSPFCVIVDGAIDLGGPRREYFGALMDNFYTTSVDEFNGRSLWETNNGMTMPRFSAVRQLYTEQMFEAFGGAVWNGLFHYLGFPVYVWRGIFRWMLNLPWDRNDIHQWSPYIGSLVIRILSGEGPLDAKTAEEVEEWALGNEGFPKHLQTGSRDVLAENIVDYELIYKHMPILLMIKRGFMKGCTEFVLACNRADWCVLERQFYRRVETAVDLLEQFVCLPDNSSRYEKAVFHWITETIAEWDPDMRKKFLRFVTAADFIPVLNHIRLIFIHSTGRNFIPAASTCFSFLKVGSSYVNKVSFVEALESAIANFENPANLDRNGRFQNF